ncbi:hypothetical protein EVAR_97837_1 [Eumeta japonica]|uniref:Uncharacterized protein n=1 Tax=Eumeta variegata TaxID=151549 RepID=A0A4C2AHH0_EUMVA|nr:hypothetical protein EVAR_97837_1 [Eumeta japonica]
MAAAGKWADSPAPPCREAAAAATPDQLPGNKSDYDRLRLLENKTQFSLKKMRELFLPIEKSSTPHPRRVRAARDGRSRRGRGAKENERESWFAPVSLAAGAAAVGTEGSWGEGRPHRPPPPAKPPPVVGALRPHRCCVTTE